MLGVDQMDKNKSLKIALIITNLFFLILIALAIALPMLVTWYVEYKGKSASLPTTILVTCYPCVPFTGASLIFLKRLINNSRKNETFSPSSIRCLKNISACFFIIAVITLVAGRYYMPFYIVGATFAFLSLVIFSLKAIFMNVASEIEDATVSDDTATDTKTDENPM